MTAEDLFDPLIARRNTRRAALARCLCGFSLFACCLGEGCTHESHDGHSLLEHVIPPHKPGSYAETVEQLEVRWNQLHEGRGASSAREISELRDLVVWLPELAADSDLDRRQWEQVQSLSNELVALQGKLAGGRVAAADRARWQQIMVSLQEFVAASDEHALRTRSTESGEAENSADEPTAASSTERRTQVPHEEL